MKKLYTLLFLLPVQAIAQPTLPNIEHYNVGYSARYMECNVVAPGAAGANKTWDFSTLSPLNALDTTIMSVTAVPANPLFPGANMVLNQPGGRTMYINKTAAETQIVGIYDTTNDAKIMYTDYVKSMVRPTTYNMMFSDNSAEIDTLQGSPANGTGVMNFNVDGWGTLKLPGGKTYTDVLRINTVLTQVDTVDFLGPIEVTFTLNTYDWYDASHQSSLLRISNVDIASSVFNANQDNVAYLLKENYPANVAAVNNSVNEVAAHLAHSSLVLSGSFQASKGYDVAVYDIAAGKQVYNGSFTTATGTQTIRMNSEPAAGTYVVIVKDNSNGSTNVVKVVKE